jgi:hypothetical protein
VDQIILELIPFNVAKKVICKEQKLQIAKQLLYVKRCSISTELQKTFYALIQKNIKKMWVKN